MRVGIGARRPPPLKDVSKSSLKLNSDGRVTFRSDGYPDMELEKEAAGAAVRDDAFDTIKDSRDGKNEKSNLLKKIKELDAAIKITREKILALMLLN